MIHGDAVFTNILINNYEKIKLIDMRGKIGNTLSIYGDKLYDYSKIYQSLIGYDEILMDTQINNEYKNKMINIFINYLQNKYKNKFNEIYKNIKLITKSLIFTLIPLHYKSTNQNILYKFYNLINSEYLI